MFELFVEWMKEVEELLNIGSALYDVSKGWSSASQCENPTRGPDWHSYFLMRHHDAPTS
jgi:hypothetical protein